MATVRLANGGDVSVKLTIEEVQVALDTADAAGGFVELPGEDGPILVRSHAVIAIIEDAKRGAAGFRIGTIAGGAG